ncbi:MAG: calcium/sodium antiporter [Bacteroidota bacterium]|nr:calcium/sodium antiporter [Bacteroidota bacterium]
MHPILLFFIGLFCLYLGGELLVKGATSLAVRIGISTLVIGLTVLSFATSAPELFVSLNAAISGNTNIMYGNIIGSNIANIALVLAITAIICPLQIGKTTYSFVFPSLLFFSIILSFLLWYTETFSYIMGIVALILLISFIFLAFKRSRSSNKKPVEDSMKVSDSKSISFLSSILFVISSIFLLKYGAEWLVDGAVYIAKIFNISDTIIAVTIVAFGTSAPELVTSVIAALRKEADLAIGNLLGSNIFNILAVLGITSLFTELNVKDMQIILFDIPWMLVVTILFGIFIYNSKKNLITRKEGLFLFLCYMIYIILSLI